MLLADRVAILRESYLFEALAQEDLQALAETSSAHNFAAGDVVFNQGTPATYVYLIASGAGEEQVRVGDDQVPIAVVSFADVAGEESLLTQNAGCFTSSLVALEEMTTLSVPLVELTKFGSSSELKSALEHEAELVDRVLMIKRATLFATLPASITRQLAAKIISRNVGAGELLVEEGRAGVECFLVKSGCFGVYQQQAPDKQIAVLGSGDLIGEVSLLAGEPRRASVIATEASEVLVLQRGALQQALEACNLAAAAVRPKAAMRMRPRRAEAVELHHRPSSDGETLLVLKHRLQLRYFQLSELGAFVWEQLDGETPLKTIIARAVTEKGIFAPQPIAEIVQALIGSGFAALWDGSTYSRPEAAQASHSRNPVSFRIELSSPDAADALATRLFQQFGFLATPTAAFSLAGVGSVGLSVSLFILVTSGISTDIGLPQILFGVISLFASILLHEIAHMLAMKAHGLSVKGFGVGWSWFYPVAFVDTSDTWIASDRQRATVALAGPLANFAIAGSVALFAFVAANVDWATALWVIATVNFAAALLAIAPNGSSDGAQALRAVLKLPPKSWSWPTLLDFKKRGFTRAGWFTGTTALLLVLSILHAAATACFVYIVLLAVAAKPLVLAFGSSATVAAVALAGLTAAVLTLGISAQQRR